MSQADWSSEDARPATTIFFGNSWMMKMRRAVLMSAVNHPPFTCCVLVSMFGRGQHLIRLVGIMLITIGFTIKGIYIYFDQFMEAYYYNPATLAIVIGFFILIIAMFGFVGAFKESTFLVNTYALLLALVLIMELSVSIAAYSMRSNIEVTLAANMKIAMQNFDREYNAFTWNVTQYNLQCCGIHSGNEWDQYGPEFNLTSISISENKTLHVPETCCIDLNCSSITSVYMRGCLWRLSAILSQCAILLTIGTLCVSLIQILGIIFSHMLAKTIRKIKTQKLVQEEERRRQFYELMLKNQVIRPKQEIVCTVEESQA